MNENIFRKKSLDKVKSPEDLNDYIRISNPTVWLLLGAVILLLVGLFVWGIFGTAETRVDILASVEGGKASFYIDETRISRVPEEAEVRLEGEKYSVSSVLAGGGEFDMTEAGVCFGSADVPLKDGWYEASLITESIAPITFFLN